MAPDASSDAAIAGSIPRLAAVGAVAGLFSGLFGVGGGVVIVPLLVLWLGYDAKVATGTSLAAIIVIAIGATITHGSLGNVHYGEALLVGLPAVGGVLLGTWAQQRLPGAQLKLVFAALLVVVGVMMVVRGVGG